MQNAAMDCILKSLKGIYRDFDANDALVNIIKNFKKEEVEKIEVKKVVEEIFKSSFAPSL